MPKKAKDKGGGQTRPIDWDRVRELAALQCTQIEIAMDQDVSVDTLSRRCKATHGCGFREYFKEKRQAGFTSLRNKQYEIAMSGNVTMLIWLGKQWLDQRDHKDPPPVPPDPQAKHTATLQDDVTPGVLDEE